MTTILWHLELSHYNEKARWALDFKGVPHERRAPMPGLHGLVALGLTHGGQRRLPVLKLDGRTIGDSTAIIAALEGAVPEPALYPEDAQERARALELEDFADEDLAPHVRRLVWHHTLGDTDATLNALMTNSSARRRRAARALIPLARPVVRMDFSINDARARESQDAIRAAADRIEAELQPSGYLVGDRFTVADLAAAALFTPLLAPPQRPYSPASLPAPLTPFRGELEARPVGRWVADMYARHRGVSAEVARA